MSVIYTVYFMYKDIARFLLKVYIWIYFTVYTIYISYTTSKTCIRSSVTKNSISAPTNF